MKKTIQPVKGTRDFYPEDMALRTWIYREIRKVSESFGYQEYEGPILESIELYAAKAGEELVSEQSFVFPDRGGKLIALRPELTLSLARMVAQRQHQLTFPIRWWSFGPMWRYERPQKGRTREFFQWNIDLVGVDNPTADAELVAVGAAFLKQVGLSSDQVNILVNNRRLMESELSALGIEPDMKGAAIRLIDRRERMSKGDWEAYALDVGLSKSQLQGLIKLFGDGSLWKKSPELIELFEAVEAMGVQEFVQFAPYTIRGLDYYTGTVFECFDRRGKYRSIFAGGRYDNLVADVGGDPVPGVGFAMGDKVISLVLADYGLAPFQQDEPQADILVTVFDQTLMKATLGLATTLREAGLRVAIYPQPVRLGKQLGYASKINARIAIIMGPDEQQAGNVTLKDLASGEQKAVAKPDLVQSVKEVLDRPIPS